MTSFFAFDPQITALTHDAARSLVAGPTDNGARRYDRAANLRPAASPAEVLTEVETGIVFRDGTIDIAAHQAAAGYDTYMYQFDYTPGDDPAHLGAAHCCELPFFFDNIDAYPNAPMLGEPSIGARALATEFSRAVAGFVATGRPNGPDWNAYRGGSAPDTVRHFG
jgi:para-nitrobenzyl esterase